MRPRENISTAPNSSQDAAPISVPGAADALQTGELFRSLIDSYPEVILAVDPAFRILIGNGKAQQLLVTADPFGKSIFDFLEVDHPERLHQVTAKSIEQGTANIECLLLCANGVRFQSVWRVSPILGPNRQPRAFLFRLEAKRELGRPEPELATLARNVSNLWAEEALVESEQRYRIVTETTIDAIATIDESG